VAVFLHRDATHLPLLCYSDRHVAHLQRARHSTNGFVPGSLAPVDTLNGIARLFIFRGVRGVFLILSAFPTISSTELSLQSLRSVSNHALVILRVKHSPLMRSNVPCRMSWEQNETVVGIVLNREYTVH